MKKILSILGVLLFVSSFMLTSCSSSGRLCPAYPPSVYQGDVQHNYDQVKAIETIDIQEENAQIIKTIRLGFKDQSRLF